MQVVVRYGCVRRDQYEIFAPGPLDAERLRQILAGQGTLNGSPALFVVDVPGVHQITVAPARGRLLVMPRLSTERAGQRQAALAVAALVASLGK